MKSIITSLVILFSVSLCANAQISPFGVKGGLNVSSIGGYTQDTSPRAGINIGIFSSLKLTRHLKLKPEMVLSNQGLKKSGAQNSYWYLNVPVMLQYKPNTPFFADLGVQVGTPLVANAEVNNKKQNITSQVQNFDFAVCLGMGVDISPRAAIEARYNLGLTDTSTSQFSSDKYQNRTFQLTLAYVLFK